MSASQRAGRVLRAGLALFLCVAWDATMTAEAQSSLPVVAPPVVKALPCATLTGPDDVRALQVAEQRLPANWLAHGGSFFASYSMAGEVRNPFDRSAGPLMGGRDGVVEALAPRCLVEMTREGRSYRFLFVAPFYRFYEAAAGWSRPLRDGLMLAVQLERDGETWREVPAGEVPTILVAEQGPRRATAEQLPKSARWREPFPPCGKGTKWTGTDCVGIRRANKG